MARGVRRPGKPVNRGRWVDDPRDDTVLWGEDEPWGDEGEQPDADPLGGRERKTTE